MPFHIRLAQAARTDVRRLGAFHARTVLAAANRQLEFDPLRETRTKKPVRIERVPFLMRNLVRAFLMTESGSDPWELRVGRWRAIYVVLSSPDCVQVLRIFEKPDHLDFITALLRWDGLDY